MNRLLSTLLICATGLAPLPAVAKIDADGARHACRNSALARFEGQSTADLEVVSRRGQDFVVQGRVKRRSKPDVYFTCNIRNGYVVGLSGQVDDNAGYSAPSSDEERRRAAAAAAALLALGLVAAGRNSGGSQTEGYSPAAGVTCIPSQRTCYQSGGISQRWTQNEFGGGTATQPVAVSNMSRHCAGEAAARFSRRPQDIATLPVERTGSGHSVFGQYPPSGRNVSTFVCTYNSRNQFVRVARTN